MVSRERYRIRTSSGYGFGRMGLPSTHRLGMHAYTPTYERARMKRYRDYQYDPLSKIKAPSDFLRRVVGSVRLVLRRFIPAPTFEGARPGYVFKTSARGLGYYLDT